MNLKDIIERQCDNMAAGTQMHEFLRDEKGNEPLLREMLRLNLEQFAQRIIAELGATRANPLTEHSGPMR